MSQYWRDMPDIPQTIESKIVEPSKLDPDRLHLRRFYGEPTYFIICKRRIIGRVDAVPYFTKEGRVDPPILLYKRFSEQLIERIKDLVNKRDGTNRDIRVLWSPGVDHPAIQKYLRNKRR